MSTGAAVLSEGLTGGQIMAHSHKFGLKASASCHMDLSIECPDDLMASFPQSVI